MSFNIIGIDPSLAGTGIAFADGSTATVKEKGYEGDKRLILIYTSVRAAIKGADAVVIEDLPANAMSAGITGRSQGVVRLALQQLGVPYIAIPPATLKKVATGKGNCKKEPMREAMQAHFDEELPTRGPAKVDDNQVDSWWLRQAGLHLFGMENHVHEAAHEGLEKYQAEADLIKEVFNEWDGPQG